MTCKSKRVLVIVMVFAFASCTSKKDSKSDEFFDLGNGNYKHVFHMDEFLVEQDCIKKGEEYIPHGQTRYFYEDIQKLASIEVYVNGKREGAAFTLYRNGTTKSDYFYTNDTLDSVAIDYHPNGKLQEIQFRRKGVRFWKQEYFDSSERKVRELYNTIEEKPLTIVDFDASGKVSKYTGSIVYQIFDDNTAKIGEEFDFAYYVVVLDSMKTTLSVSLNSEDGAVLWHNTISSYKFIPFFNAYQYFPKYTFTKDGTYTYSAYSQIVDPSTNKIIANDTNILSVTVIK